MFSEKKSGRPFGISVIDIPMTGGVSYLPLQTLGAKRDAGDTPDRKGLEASQAIEMEWLFSIMNEGEDAEPSVADLAKYVRGLNEVIVLRKYSLLNTAMSSVSRNVSQISTRTLITLARAISPIGPHLQIWREFLTSVASILEQRGKDRHRLLKGLI